MRSSRSPKLAKPSLTMLRSGGNVGIEAFPAEARLSKRSATHTRGPGSSWASKAREDRGAAPAGAELDQVSHDRLVADRVEAGLRDD